MNGQSPVRSHLQKRGHQDAVDNDLNIDRVTKDTRQRILQPLLDHDQQCRAKNCAANGGGAADNGHEQIFDAGIQAEGSRVYEAQHVRIKPA